MKKIFFILLLLPALSRAQVTVTPLEWNHQGLRHVRLTRESRLGRYLTFNPDLALTLQEQYKNWPNQDSYPYTYKPPPQSIDVQHFYTLSSMTPEKRTHYLDHHRWLLFRTRDTGGIKIETYVYRFRNRYNSGRWFSSMSVVYEKIPKPGGAMRDKLIGLVYYGTEPLVYQSSVKFLENTHYTASTISDDPFHVYPVVDYKNFNREFLVKRSRLDNIPFDFFSITYCMNQ